MHAIIAIESSQTRQNCQQFLKSLDFGIDAVKSIEELELSIKKKKPKFVLCDLYFKHAFLGDLPKRYENLAMKWIGMMQLTDGAGAEYYLKEHAGFTAVLDAEPSFIDLYIAVRQIVLKQQDPLRLALPESSIHRWLRASMSTPIASSNSFNPPYPDANMASTVSGMRPPPVAIDNLKPELKSWFQARHAGNLAHTAFAAILWKIHSQKNTGVLKLYRDDIKLALVFKNGLPITGTTNHPQLDIFDTAKRQNIIDAKLYKRIEKLQKQSSASRYDCLAMLPKPLETLKAWLKLALLDIFAWRDGAYNWQSSKYHANPPLQAEFSNLDIQKLIYEGVYERTPLHIILSACKDYASYFLKLKASQNDAGRFFFSPKAKAIVQRLEKGDTLMEMLIYFPPQYPVHQTVYLLFIFGYLDLE